MHLDHESLKVDHPSPPRFEDPVSEADPRIAVYRDPRSPPEVHRAAGQDPSRVLEVLASRTWELALELGGRIPYPVLRELVDNLLHADLRDVVISVLDQGNTVRIADHGPGIADKQRAMQPGFSTADPRVKRLARGVGSGLFLVREMLAALQGSLEIEDNLDRGTVVTVRVPPVPTTPEEAQPAVPTVSLTERQLKVLLLVVELGPVGPIRIAREVGISGSTAYRELLALEQAGLVAAAPGGQRVCTDAGLVHLEAVL